MHPAPTWLMPDRAAGDLEGQIYRGLRDRILSGQMAAAQRLPSTRATAAALGVARSTVVHAYDRLKAEGYLDGRPGSATVVAAIAPAPAPRRAPSPVPVAAGAGGEAPPRLYAPGMPDLAREYAYDRLWEILTGRDNSPEFQHLSETDRTAIMEILQDTKPEFGALAAARSGTPHVDFGTAAGS